jgi:hypothetical protein
MDLSYQDVTLANDTPDHQAMLVFRGGRLLAVLTCLGDLHGDLAGQWFIEAIFQGVQPAHTPVFESLPQFEDWLADV